MNLHHFGTISHLHHLQTRSDFINCDLFNLSINAFFLFKPIVISHLCVMFYHRYLIIAESSIVLDVFTLRFRISLKKGMGSMCCGIGSTYSHFSKVQEGRAIPLKY